jgi:hypothetical protein
MKDLNWNKPARLRDKSDIAKLNAEYPISRNELAKILKAKRMTKQDLSQLLHEWTDD